jgi:ankyrin repeat protein
MDKRLLTGQSLAMFLLGLMLMYVSGLYSMAGGQQANRDVNQKLIDAVKARNIEQIQRALDEGADMNTEDPHLRRSPLVLAALRGYLEIVSLLIKHGANVNHTDSTGFTALLEAARRGHTPIARLLIEGEADINYADRFGVTALEAAAVNGHLDVTRLLVQHGANVNRANNQGNTILLSTLTDTMRLSPLFLPHTLEIARLLIERGAMLPYEEDFRRIFNVTLARGREAREFLQQRQRAREALRALFGDNQLAYEGTRGNLDEVKRLLGLILQQTIDANVVVQGAHQVGRQDASLWQTIMNGVRPVLSYFYQAPVPTLAHHYPDINVQDENGRTALHWAAATGQVEMVCLLLNHGANWLLQTREGLTAAEIANRNRELALCHCDTIAAKRYSDVLQAITNYMIRGLLTRGDLRQVFRQLIVLERAGVLPAHTIEQLITELGQPDLQPTTSSSNVNQ